MRGSMRRTTSQIIILGGVACLCALLVAPVGAFPLNMGTYDEEKMGKHKEAEELLRDLDIKMKMDVYIEKGEEVDSIWTSAREM